MVGGSPFKRLTVYDVVGERPKGAVLVERRSGLGLWWE